MPRKVCIAVDPSHTSQNALVWAAKTVVNKGDEVKLFTVVHPSPESELRSGVGSVAGGARTAPVGAKLDADPQEAAKAQQLLEQAKAKAVEQGVPPASITAETLVAQASGSADVGRELTSKAEECGCESLVMGSRGLGLSKKALMGLLGIGSVSDYVLKHAPCNVVLYKDRPEGPK